MFGKKKTEPVSSDKPGESVRKTGMSRRNGPDPNDWTDKRNYKPELAKRNTNMLPVKVTGTILILLTAGAVVVTSKSAVTALSRSADNHLAAVSQAIADKEAASSLNQKTDDGKTVVQVDGNDDSTAKYVKSYDFTTDQLDWAHEKHIRWDDYGNPVDESGKVVDDPTTDVNEIDRAKEAGTIDDAGKSKKADSAKTPDEIIENQKDKDSDTQSEAEKPAETPAAPADDDAAESTKQASADGVYANNPKITHDSDGKYRYHIVWGDTLTKIARETGCDVNTLVQLNGIPNPNLIITGHVIVLPDPGAVGSPAPVAGVAGGSAPVTNGQSGNGLG